MQKSIIVLAILGAAATGYLVLGGTGESKSPASVDKTKDVSHALETNAPSVRAPTLMPRRMRSSTPDSASSDESGIEAELADRLERQERRNQRRMEAFQRFDGNQDGELDEQERQAMRTERMAQRAARDLEFFDSDGDGELSEDELATKAQARSNAMAERASQLIVDADTDGSGGISRAEAEAGNRRMQRLLRDFDDIDRDGDAQISAEEVQEAMSARRGARGPRGRDQSDLAPGESAGRGTF